MLPNKSCTTKPQNARQVPSQIRSKVPGGPAGSQKSGLEGASALESTKAPFGVSSADTLPPREMVIGKDLMAGRGRMKRQRRAHERGVE